MLNFGHYVNVNIRKIGLIVRNMFDSNTFVSYQFWTNFSVAINQKLFKTFYEKKKIVFLSKKWKKIGNLYNFTEMATLL